MEVVVDGSRQDVWHALTSEAGVTSWLAPAAQIHAVEGGEWRVAFDSRGAHIVDGGEILTYARDQQLTVEFPAPAAMPALKGGSTRLHFLIEPVDRQRQRVIVHQEPFGEGSDWERLRAHLQAAWEGPLERLRRRMLLQAPTISEYDPFWAGL